MLPFIIFTVFIVTMAIAAYSDAMTMTIPNWVSAVLLAAFFIIIPFVWQSWPIFGEHLLVCFFVFAFSFALFAFNALGAGDSKLMAATAIWWQWPDLLIYALYTAVAGGLLGLLVLLIRARGLQKLPGFSLIPTLNDKEAKLPYGIALAIGALLTLPQSEIFKTAVNIG